ncbi:tetratricopeptide repeat protein [Desulfonema magnum]|uniref:Tetratricopeptide repeat-containing protein n=1 Tax=Desulfonema magnum TaxID=45655 RepID=A0A975GK28_9BACT|nr:hypothetical protein [Desulfonema magnum]QTA84177.1 Tetratricopeptide repeat-containing protein [Desulfonema magnum]
MSHDKKFIEKINKLTEKIESEPENAKHYRKRANLQFENDEFDMALNDYDKAIEIYPKITDYFERGVTHLKMKNHDKAFDDFSQIIKLKPVSYFKLEIPLSYLLRGYCYYKMGDEENSLRDLSSFENSLKKNLPYGICDAFIGKKFLKKLQKYRSILKETVTDSSILFMLKVMELLFDLSHKREIFDLARFLDRFNFESDTPPNIQGLISEIFQYYPDFNGNVSEVSKRDGKEYFFMNAKLAILEYKYFRFQERGKFFKPVISIIFVSFCLLSYYIFGPLMGLILFITFIVALICSPIAFDSQISLYFDLNKLLQKKKEQERIQVEIEHERKIARAKIQERNKVIADLSHSIKNLVKTVIDPLENLKQEAVVKPQVIQNALKGANLIREIVNAMNLSFRGSIDDFYYDAEHSTGKDSLSFQSVIIESLRYSAGNMFDGKYFGKFQKQYFPTKDIFLSAKSEWANVSQADDSDMYVFLKKYFFETDITFGDAETYVMGNDRGSAVKFLILFQEIILNAVKYVAFVEKEKRFLHIRFTSHTNQISVSVENPFRPNVKAKTTGIGHVIIENFAKLLNADSPVVNKDGNLWSVEIRFPNFWKERKNQ